MARVEFAQVVSHGCGMDIHKEVVVATVRTPSHQETREFKTFTSSLTEMREWLKSSGVTHVAMESTGVYWKPIYNVLEGFIPEIWVVNARHIKNVPGHKTDRMDSEWICKLLMAGLLKNSYIPPREQRELRDLTRYRRKLVQSVTADKNRIIRVLEDGNIKLSSVLSSTSGVTGEKLTALLCTGKKLTIEDVRSVYHKKIQASPEEILEACTGNLTSHQIFMVQLIQSNIKGTRESILLLDDQIRELLVPYDNALEAICGIPGIERKVAEDLIAEIGLDMGKFPSEKHLASWAGMCPGNNESAGKKKVQERITETNK
ncbi:IS110 family transposase [Prevotella cerevisiae]|jgi:transposase|uniref:IS110 family transposase n=1 Tax=Segatella cerevisiae TaxID=2053716 RepID=A0ABT1C1W7_9BACT|nr:IS110 family transposase [Segatella cerevisiae]MCH3994441.1 IS110 family transposase [Prevotella sp.]MCO6026638.1 IS110 family transposase [Segatella cerevisiae]